MKLIFSLFIVNAVLDKCFAGGSNIIFKDRKVLLWITLVLTYLLTYLRTYLRTHVQVIFRRSYPTLKLTKQKMSEIIQVNVPIFFLFCRNPKNDKVRAKKPILEPKNQNKSVRN